MTTKIKPMTQQNIRNILNGTYSANDNTVSEGDEIIKYHCHPLLSIYLHTLLSSTKDDVCYDGVFEDRKALLSLTPQGPEFDGAKKFVHDIIEYYKTELTWKRLLSNGLFSEWERELNLFLDLADKNCCKEKHISMFVKLPQFYKTAIEFDNNYQTNKCQSFKMPEENFWKNIKTKWKYVWSTQKHTKRDKKHTYHYFMDDKNRLTEFKTPDNQPFDSILHNLWGEQYLDVEATVKVREKVSLGATYYYCENFKIS